MKKYLIFASAALIALAACNKEPLVQEPTQNEGSVVLTFTSKRPELGTDTKTAWNATTKSIVWTSGDAIRVGYTFNDSWMGKSATGSPKFYASEDVSIDGNDSGLGTFNVPGDFESPSTEGDYVFYGVYPKPAGTDFVSSESVATLTLPATQTPGAATFDKTADIMIGKSAPKTLSALPTDPIEITWDRIVAHADITFSNLAFDGTESVSSIKLTFDDNAKVAGTFTVNVKTGVVTAGSESEVLINGDNLVAGSNSVEAWCCLLPVTFSALDVEIKTDQATYTRSITGVSKTFKKNGRNTLTVNMATAKRTANAPLDYALYSGDLVEGDYIIYDATDGHAMKAETSSNRFSYAEVAPINGVISTNDASILWHIAPSGTDGYFTIYNSATGKYAAATGSKNQGQLLDSGTDDKSLWSVSGTYDFINKARAAANSDPNNKYLRSNDNSGFACYASSTGHTLELYNLDSREPLAAPASVSAALDGTVSNTINVTFSTVSGADSYVITATPTVGGDAVVKNDVTGSPAAIEGLAYDTEYAISVYAVPASNDADHKKSSATAASSTVTTGAKPAAPEGYELITSIDNVTTGLYIIAAKVGDNYIGIPNKLGASPFAGTALTVTNNVVLAADASDFSLTITENAGKYTIVGDGGTLGYGSSTSFNLSASGNAALWTIAAANIKGSFRIANVGTTTRAIVYRAGSTNKFGAYATSNITASGEYYDVELFKFNGVVKTNPTTTVTPSSPINLEVSETQQLNVETNSDGAVSYESSDEDVATVTSAGLIEAIAAGTATITVKTAVTDTYYESTKTVTVNVTNGPSSIADVISASNNASVYTAGVVAQTNQKGFVITDGTDNILVYQNAVPSVAVGQAVNIHGTRSVYNNVPQISSPTITSGEAGQTVTRTTLTTISSSNATGFTTSQYVSLTGTLTNSGNYYNVSISGSETKGSLYNISTSASYTGGTLASLVDKMVTVTGYVAGSTDNYLNIAVVDIIIDPNAPSLTVSPETTSASPASWPADNNEAKTFTITPTNGSWLFDDSDISGWATVSRTDNVLTVTPIAKQATEAHSGSIVITLTPSQSGYSVLTETIYLAQAKYSDDPGETYTLTTDSAAGQAYQYSVKTVTETDKSEWKLYGYGSNNSLWQLGGNKGGGSGAEKCAYILTPECSSDITTITVNCRGSNYVAIYSADASTLLTGMVKKPSSSLGDLVFSLPAGNTQVKIMFTTQSDGTLSIGTNAACYINSVTVTTD